MFPYIPEPALQLGSVRITAFEVCVFAAVICGFEITVRRCVKRGWDHNLVLDLVLWTIGLGFVGSHVFDVLAYQSDALRARPWLLLEVWGSMSSFGGLLGGIAGAWWITHHKRLTRAQIGEFFEVVAFAFPFSWIFGRLGCALAHDHIGVETSSLLAVRFPGGPRFDLGLLELFWTLAISALWLWLDRRPRPNGFFAGLFFLLYGPVRFALDTLRTGDERWLGWTAGQYLSLVAIVAGAFILLRALRRKPA
ncbi:MAG TPA: prolipoprotein diacylglyceryl transferase family protein [Myxococcales bacterium]|nr:prolipoprotein diacylglyceryl transferase family protein [Myxococcales bacterium]